MAHTDAIVLGAGIVRTSIALQLAKRALGVAPVDRRAPGEETSYGNAGIIEDNTILSTGWSGRSPTSSSFSRRLTRSGSTLPAPAGSRHPDCVGKAMFQMMGVFAAFERSMIHRAGPGRTGASQSVGGPFLGNQPSRLPRHVYYQEPQ
jgi:hypothetical protein